MSKNDLKQSSPEDSGAGLDCGTMNFVAARRNGKSVKTSRIRDAFIELPLDARRMLKLANTSYAELDGRLLVLGDEALETANLLNREARRPMSGGVITPGEVDAQRVISLLVQQVLGTPRKEKERCCFSVPAPAVDVSGSDVSYHKFVLQKILTELNYSPEAINEAHAIIYSECASESFSGLGISFGSGMTNVALSFNSMSALEFSVARGGDWVDVNSAKAVGSTAARMCALKESGAIDISKKQNLEGEAISVFIEGLIDYAIKNVIQQFHKVRRELLVPKPIPLIVSGGTSLATGFLDKFKDRFQVHREKFPVQISEIRPARDPMMAVSTGLLLLSQTEDA